MTVLDSWAGCDAEASVLGNSGAEQAPTVFKRNSKRHNFRPFWRNVCNDFTYRYEAESSDYFNNRAVFGLMLLINRLLPAAMKLGRFVFLRKIKGALGPCKRRWQRQVVFEEHTA